MEIVVLIILIFSCLAIWGFFQLGSDGDKRANIKAKVAPELPEGAHILVKIPMTSFPRGIGFGDGKLILIDHHATETLPISAVVSAEVVTDNATLHKVSRGSQVAGGLVGAAIAGPVGAIIGGLGASGRSVSAPPNSVKLRLITTSRTYPKFDVDFIEMTATGKTHGMTALDEAETWFARIQGMLHEHRNG